MTKEDLKDDRSSEFTAIITLNKSQDIKESIIARNFQKALDYLKILIKVKYDNNAVIKSLKFTKYVYANIYWM